MDGPGISAASDLKLLFSAFTHFRGRLANFAQNQDVIVLIEAMCSAAQARLGQSVLPSATAQLNDVDLHSARLADHLNNYRELDVGLTHPSELAEGFISGPSANLSVDYGGWFAGFPA
jgi:hypothetical protein